MVKTSTKQLVLHLYERWQRDGTLGLQDNELDLTITYLTDALETLQELRGYDLAVYRLQQDLQALRSIKRARNDG